MPPPVIYPPQEPEPLPEPLPEVKPEEEKCPEGGYTYVVQQGDTLAKIADRYQDRVPGLTWQHIARHNSMYPPYSLSIGQVIRIPCVAGKG